MQVVVEAVGDGRKALDAARRHDHAGGLEGTAGDGRADIARPVDHVGQRLHVTRVAVGLLGDGHARGLAHHQVRLHLGRIAQHLQQADAVDLPGGAGHADDQAFSFRPPVHGHRAQHRQPVAHVPQAGRLHDPRQLRRAAGRPGAECGR